MAYFTGSAANFGDLKIAIENACTVNGWSLTNDVLSKGAAFFKLVATSTSQLTLQGGTGQSGSTLTGEPTNFVKVMSATSNAMAFPINYEIHITASPEEEVYCVINYNSNFYQLLSFGVSTIPGIGGTGAWFTGSYDSRVAAGGNGSQFDMNDSRSVSTSGGTRGFWGLQGGLFFEQDNTNTYTSSYFHCGLDSVGWNSSRGNLGYPYCAALINSLPNLSNAAIVLCPMKAIKKRSSGGLTIVVNPPNVRYCRIDNLTPGQLVVYGSDRWKIYPFYRKELSDRNGNANAIHSGTYGFAIKYTGA